MKVLRYRHVLFHKETSVQYIRRRVTLLRNPTVKKWTSVYTKLFLGVIEVPTCLLVSSVIRAAGKNRRHTNTRLHAAACQLSNVTYKMH